MSLAAASPPSKSAAPPVTPAALQRAGASHGFDRLLNEEDAGRGGVAAPPARAAGPTSSVPDLSEAKRGPGAGAAAGAATRGRIRQPRDVQPPSDAGGLASTGSASPSSSPAAATPAQGPGPSAALSPPAKPPLPAGGGPRVADGGADDAGDVEAGAQEGAQGDTAGTAPTPQAGSPAAAAANGATGPAAASPAAQPLLNALVGAGATRVTAQVSASAAAGRPTAGAAGRLKASAAPGAGNGEAGGAATRAPAPAAFPDAATPNVPAVPADGGGTGDDPAGDDAAGEGGQDMHGQPAPDTQASALGASAFTPATLASAPAAQAGAQAASLSASAADLAAQMAARAGAGASQFRLQLNPLGLGQVDVTVSIGADRQLTAALAFADPQTARALSAHAGELRTVLEQAGFSVPANGVDFSAISSPAAHVAQPGSGFQSGFGGGGSGHSGGGHPQGGGFAAEAPLTPAGAAASAWSSGADTRLDIRI